MPLPSNFNSGWKQKITPSAPPPPHHCWLCDNKVAWVILVTVIILGLVPLVIALNVVR